MGWISDFLYSSISDTLLPVVRPLLEDVVMEVLNDRQVPTRTDFREVRDLVNGMRGTVSTAGTTAKKLAGRIEALEVAQAEQAALIAALQARLEAAPPPAAAGATAPKRGAAKPSMAATTKRKKPPSKAKKAS